MTTKAYITFSTNSKIENDPLLKQYIQDSDGSFTTVLLDGHVYAVIKPMEKESYEAVRHIAGTVARDLRARKMTAAVLDGEVLKAGVHTLSMPELICAFVEGWELGSYQFLTYKSDQNQEKTELEIVNGEEYQEAIDKGYIRSQAVSFSRDLMNEIPSVLHPESYPLLLQKTFKSTSAKIKIYDKKALEEMEMNGVLAVGKGSKYEPSFVEISYCNDPSKPLVALVGKGVTFDTGGISLKSGRDISDMKMDMGGSAAVAGAMKLLVDSNAKVNVVALIPIVENMPDRQSMIPSDVISYKNGLNVQVGNTDAEGRLILADGLIRAGELKAEYIVDIATLTGAIGSALGSKLAGVFGAEELTQLIKTVGKENGDYVWPLPLVDEYDAYLNSDYADFSNISSKGEAGAITAALFLRRFVPQTAKWLHIDMASVMMSHAEKGYYTKAATGFGARLLADYTNTLSN